MSKPIGDLTLKAAPVGADMIAIADSQDSNKTKKILVSAISGGGGGGASNVHIVENVTYSSGVYSGTSADVTQYQDGHLYIFNSPNSNISDDSRSLNINSLGAKTLDYHKVASDFFYKKEAIQAQSVSIVCYNSITDKFYLVATDRTIAQNYGLFDYLYTSTNSFIQYEPIKQVRTNAAGTTPEIIINTSSTVGGVRVHRIYRCNSVLSSLSIRLPNVLGDQDVSTWETEIHFTTGATFTYSETGNPLTWIGVNAPTFDPNTSYVIAIKNAYAVLGKVGA